MQVEDALPYDAADDKMICCMKSLKMTNQKKHKSKLKKAKKKSGQTQREVDKEVEHI